MNTINPAPAFVQLTAEEQAAHADTPTNVAPSAASIAAERVPTAVETLEHLENTLDNLDPVVPPVVPEGTVVLDNADVEAVAAPIVDEGKIDEKAE